MIDTIIFDFDGIILDSEPLHFEAWRVTLTDLGIKLDFRDYITNYTGQTDTDMIPRLLRDKKIPLTEAEIHALVLSKIKAFDKITQAMPELPLIPDFDLFLPMIAQRYTNIGICSGSYRSTIHGALSKLQNGRFKSYFKVIVTAEDITKGKPSPEGYLLAAKQLQRKPEQCLVIEDSPPGIQAARSAGMRVLGLLTTYDREKLAEADFLAENYQELMNEDKLSSLFN